MPSSEPSHLHFGRDRGSLVEHHPIKLDPMKTQFTSSSSRSERSRGCLSVGVGTMYSIEFVFLGCDLRFSRPRPFYCRKGERWDTSFPSVSRNFRGGQTSEKWSFRISEDVLALFLVSRSPSVWNSRKLHTNGFNGLRGFRRVRIFDGRLNEFILVSSVASGTWHLHYGCDENP